MVLYAANASIVLNIMTNADINLEVYYQWVIVGLINSFGTGVQAIGDYIFGFTIVGGVPTIPIWTIKSSKSKADQGLVFGYPESTYFLHLSLVLT